MPLLDVYDGIAYMTVEADEYTRVHTLIATLTRSLDHLEHVLVLHNVRRHHHICTRRRACSVFDGD